MKVVLTVIIGVILIVAVIAAALSINAFFVMLAWGMAYSYGAVAGTLAFTEAFWFALVLGMGVTSIGAAVQSSRG